MLANSTKENKIRTFVTPDATELAQNPVFLRIFQLKTASLLKTFISHFCPQPKEQKTITVKGTALPATRTPLTLHAKICIFCDHPSKPAEAFFIPHPATEPHS